MLRTIPVSIYMREQWSLRKSSPDLCTQFHTERKMASLGLVPRGPAPHVKLHVRGWLALSVQLLVLVRAWTVWSQPRKLGSDVTASWLVGSTIRYESIPSCLSRFIWACDRARARAGTKARPSSSIVLLIVQTNSCRSFGTGRRQQCICERGLYYCVVVKGMTFMDMS